MGDYISRDGLIKYINENGLVYANTLKTFPAADVRPVVHGRWDKHSPLGYKCSLCGCLMSGRSNFCPCCGANMRGEKNNDV